MRPFLHNEDGSVLAIYALAMSAIAVLMSVVLTFGMQYLEDRRMQALADLIALLAVRDQDYTSEYALEIIEDQGLSPLGFAPILTPGRYIPDRGLQPYHRFVAERRPYNAVRVNLHARIAGDGGRSYIGHQLAEAAAARRDTASFAVGSRLARLEGGLTGDLLAALIGYDGRITAMDYDALAAVRIDSVSFLNALVGESRIRAATYEEVLDTEVAPQSVLRAARLAAGSEAPGALDRIADSALQRGSRVRIGDILEARAIAPEPLLDGLLGAEISVLDLIEATAYAANTGHQVAVDLDAHLAAVSLAIGERPQFPPIGAASLPGDRAETRQLDLLTRLRLGLSDVDVRLEAAMAEAELTGLRCGPGRRVRADFDVTTSPARLVIESGGLLGRVLSVDLGSGERRRVTMNQNHIATGTPETLSSGSGASIGLLDASLPLGGLTDPVWTEIDRLAESLGLHLAEADLFLRGASCGRPFLIE